MYEDDISEKLSDIASYQEQKRDAEFFIKRYTLVLGSMSLRPAQRNEYMLALDVQRGLHDAAVNHIHCLSQEIAELDAAEASDRETLAAYGSLTVDMRGE